MTASRTRWILLFACTVGVLATIVAVAAMAIPIYVADDAAHKANACQHEYQNVQDGLYAYMANNSLTTVAASAGTSDMTYPILLYIKDASAAKPSYVPNSQTEWMYGWDSTGRINSISMKRGGPSILVGCDVSG